MQLLSITAFGLSEDPTVPPCLPLGVPREGKLVHALVVLAHSGQEWVAHSAQGTPDDLELEISGLGFRRMGGEAVTGRIRGSATDVSIPSAWMATGVQVSLSLDVSGGYATLEGNTAGSAPVAMGRVSGVVRFTNAAGESATCTVATWMLQPYPG